MSDYEFSDDDNEYYDEDEEMIDPEDGMSATLRLLCARWGHQPSQLRNTHTLAAALSAAPAIVVCRSSSDYALQNAQHITGVPTAHASHP